MMHVADVTRLELERGDHLAVGGTERLHGDTVTHRLPGHRAGVGEGPPVGNWAWGLAVSFGADASLMT